MFFLRTYVYLYLLVAMLTGCAGQHAETRTQRIVVIGDIHADIGIAHDAFQLAGGTVYVLIGNHEVFGARLELR